MDIAFKGYTEVEIIDGAEKILLPKNFYTFCNKYDIDIPMALYMIASDFITRVNDGNNIYSQGLLNKIKNSDKLTDEQKSLFFHIILEN